MFNNLKLLNEVNVLELRVIGEKGLSIFSEFLYLVV